MKAADRLIDPRSRSGRRSNRQPSGASSVLRGLRHDRDRDTPFRPAPSRMAPSHPPPKPARRAGPVGLECGALTHHVARRTVSCARTALTYKIWSVRVIWSESPAITSVMTQNTSGIRLKNAIAWRWRRLIRASRNADDLSAELKLKRKGLKRRSHAITTPSAFGSVA
jgi:hypothetical protein